MGSILWHQSVSQYLSLVPYNIAVTYYIYAQAVVTKYIVAIIFLNKLIFCNNYK